MKKSEFVIVKIIMVFILCATGIRAPLHALAAPSVEMTHTFLSDWYRSDAQGIVTSDMDEAVECSIDGGAFEEGGVSLNLTVSGDGVHEIVCRTASDEIHFTVKIDSTPPVINFSGWLPLPNANGWNNTDVTVDWSCDDATSSVAVFSNKHQTISTEGSGLTAISSCTDNAGNVATDTVLGINIDKTSPDVTVTLPPSFNGWYNTDVTPVVSRTDDLSKIDTCSADPPTINAEGAQQIPSVSCIDKAGNKFQTAPVTVKIDKTPPTIVFLGPFPNEDGFTDPVTFRWLCSDELSGVVALESNQTISKEGQGQSATGTCKDMAGNINSNTVNGINIKFDDSQDSESQNSNESGEGTQAAENPSFPEQFPNLNFAYLWYILGGVVVALLIGWLVFFLKKK
jgi:hypothetical protein